MFGWLIEHPWWFLLIIPLAIGIATRKSATYISKAHSHIAPSSLNKSKKFYRAWQRFAFAVPKWTKAFALFCVIIALVDITMGHTYVIGKKTLQRFFVTEDASSSMYGFGTPHKTVTCKQNGVLFPRIKGACRALYRLVDEVEKETKDETRPRVLLALGLFATRSAIVSYPTSDYGRFRTKIDLLEFKEHGLGKSTFMHEAIWDLFLMALDRNMRKDSAFTHLTGNDMQTIYKALGNSQEGSLLYIPKEVAEKLERIKNEMRDTVFFVPTDALVSFLSDRMDKVHPSIRRLMQLAETLEIPVYFLSTDEDYPELRRLAQHTGFGPLGGPQRGDFLMVRREKDDYLIDELVSKILKSRLGMTVPTYSERRESYSDIALELALTLLGFGILWRKFVARSLTDLE